MTESAHDNVSEKQDVLLYSKKHITLTGIAAVDFFDESSISVTTVSGEMLVVQGSGITLSDVSLDSGAVTADGEFTAIYYTSRQQRKSGLLSRLFER